MAPLCIALLAPLICAPVAPGYVPEIEEAFADLLGGQIRLVGYNFDDAELKITLGMTPIDLMVIDGPNCTPRLDESEDCDITVEIPLDVMEQFVTGDFRIRLVHASGMAIYDLSLQPNQLSFVT